MVVTSPTRTVRSMLCLLAALLPLIVLAPASAPPLAAQPTLRAGPTLLADINTTRLPLDASPSRLTVVGERLLFFARDRLHGWSLWSTSGSAEDVSFITELGTSSDIPPVPAAIALGSLLLFVYDDGIHGSELWRSDGTREGTVIVRDIRPGPDSSITYASGALMLLATERQVFFLATDGVHGWGLWASDGTAGGTSMLRELRYSVEGLPLIRMISAGDQLLFNEIDPLLGNELWVSDGTSAGTRLVRDINPGSASSNPYDFGVIGGTLYLTVDDGVHGYELWRSDGTAGGTMLVADLNPGPASSWATRLTPVGDLIYLLARDASEGLQLWQSDGTTEGTTRVARPPEEQAPFPATTLLHSAAGRLFVEEHGSGTRLWSGAPGAELVLLRQFTSGTFTLITARDTALIAIKGADADDGLWRSDGTGAGTVKLAYLLYLSELTPFGDLVFFAATHPDFGSEVWVSDSSASGTHLLKDLHWASHGSEAHCLTIYGGHIFFSADDGVHGYEPWISDGTAGGTRLLADLVPGLEDSYPCGYTSFGPALTFNAGGRLWRTDETADGTRLITTSDQPDGVLTGSALTVVGDLGFFSAGQQNSDLWTLSSDLSSARLVYHFQLTGKYGAMPLTPRYAVGNRLVFGKAEFYLSSELWSSDGTPGGTLKIAPGGVLLDTLGDRILYMTGSEDEGRAALWATDGTPTGSARLSAGYEYSPWDFFFLGASAGGRLFFGSPSSAGGWLAVSDGTGAQAQTLGRFTTSFDNLVADDSGAFFVVFSRSPTSMEAELWHTDSTAQNTRPVHSYTSTDWMVKPDELRFIGDRLVFAAGDEAHGRELWVSDGTAFGTQLCQDLNPGPASSAPRLLEAAAVLNGNLIIAADDGIHGDELWLLPVSSLCDLKVYLPLVGSAPRP